MPGSFALDGRRYRLDRRTPTHEIAYLVSKLHIGLTDEQVLAELGIANRLAHYESSIGKRSLVKIVRQSERYAIYCHRRNQKLYWPVIRGTFLKVEEEDSL